MNYDFTQFASHQQQLTDAQELHDEQLEATRLASASADDLLEEVRSLKREVALLRGNLTAAPDGWRLGADNGFETRTVQCELGASVWWTAEQPERFQAAIYDDLTGDALWRGPVHASISDALDEVHREWEERIHRREQQRWRERSQ